MAEKQCEMCGGDLSQYGERARFCKDCLRKRAYAREKAKWAARRKPKSAPTYNNKQCKTCLYGTTVGISAKCDYFTITGCRRGCETYPTCEKYKRKSKKGLSALERKRMAIQGA